MVDDYIRLNRRTVKTITNTNRKESYLRSLERTILNQQYGTEKLNMHSKEMTIIIKIISSLIASVSVLYKLWRSNEMTDKSF